MLVFVVVYNNERRIRRAFCESLLAYFLVLCWGFCPGRVLYFLLSFLDICHMFHYQSMYVVGFVSFLFYLILVLLSRAMGIFLLHMCIMVCVMVGGSMLVQ